MSAPPDDDLVRRNRLLTARAGHVCQDTRWLLRCLSETRAAIAAMRDLRTIRQDFTKDRRHRAANPSEGGA